MNAHLVLASGAAVVSFAFALSTLERWLDRRKPQEAAWSAALFLFTAAALALLAGVAMGWNAVTFRCFYLFGAVIDVPYLALGTVWLLGGARWGRPVTTAVHCFALFAAGVITVAPLTGPIPADRLPQGAAVFGPLPRLLAALGSAAPATVIVVGALFSAGRLMRRHSSRRLALANVLIASGTIVLGAGGVLNSVLDEMDGFAVSLLAGIVLLFAGFLLTNQPPRALQAVQAA
ncbi:MAG: hypothetical protein ACR2LQ_01185 [Acidimicrobiales bacterium]